jgi:hypothetical protein
MDHDIAAVSIVLKRAFELLFSIRHKVFRLMPVSSANSTRDNWYASRAAFAPADNRPVTSWFRSIALRFPIWSSDDDSR